MIPHDQVIANAIERTERGIRWGHAEQENITDALKELVEKRAEEKPQSASALPSAIKSPRRWAFSISGDGMMNCRLDPNGAYVLYEDLVVANEPETGVKSG